MDPIRKKTIVVPESAHGVCLWQLDETSKYGAGFVSDSDRNYLCMEGLVGDPRVERAMAEAVEYWTGETGGRPIWKAGHRQISDSEFDDQNERLEVGLIPDWEEAAKLMGSGQ